MGAHVTVGGPPTLIPRGIEALGCDVRYTLDDLGEADVVYALRMQHERMSETCVPSLREYAARYQINGRRLGPRQMLMHPGPVNRGVELCGEVVDSPQAVISQQVEAGVVVRMAVLYELLAGAHACDAAALTPEPPRAGERRRIDADPLGATSRPPTCSSAARTCSTRAPASTPPPTCSSATARSPRSARPARSTRPRAPRSSTARGATCSRPSSTRTSTCARPGQEHKEDLETGTRAAAAGGFCAVVAMPNTDPVVDSRAAPALAARRGAARGAHPRRLHGRDHARPAPARS